MQTINSKDNPKLKAVRALVRSKKDRQEASAFVMEGVRALSALADGSALPQYRLKEVWVSSDAPELAAAFTVPVYAVARDVMEQLSDCCASQGILGVVEYAPEPLAVNPEQGNYLLVDGLTDPGNLGTLIRSAVAFGFDGVFLHGDTVEVFNPKTVRATMGALPFSRHWKTGGELFQTLEKNGYDLISTVIHGGENLHEMKFGPKNVLVIGNEAHGVSGAVQKLSTRRLSIPMSGNAESLNAAVAGSICMFSMQRKL
ncbi:MAG: RNA methyltransferase [Kiritimatiellales bacterium]|jgi:TrmH family RNA methyltransferase